LKKLGGELVVSFYDVTTLHFESESEGDLRRIGFSKEGKIARPQIQLGLFTTLQGYPLAYEVFEGNRFEGNTLIDLLINFQERFNLQEKPIVVADCGMLNNNNITLLQKSGYRYILGAEIKTRDIKLEYKISNKILRDLIKHIFAFNIDGKMIPMKLSKIQQDFYDALNS